MSTHDFISLVAALCGFIMVMGGVVLLYRGTITLSERPAEDAVSLEFRKMFKLKTQYPALGIFVIGLAFVATPLFLTRADAPVRIRANLVQANQAPSPDEVSIRVAAEWSGAPPDTDGRIDQRVPLPNQFWVLVSAPGYTPYRRQLAPSMLTRTVSLGAIVLTRAAGIKAAARPTEIVQPQHPLPAMDSPYRFN
jgi:hypothetical protein